MPEPVSQAVEPELEAEGQFPLERAKDGTFGPGNTASVGQSRATGVVAYIRAQTNNYQEMLDLLIKVMRGEKLNPKDKWAPGPKERIDCAKELLDRAIGKPTQTIIDSGEGVSKELLSTFQKILKGQGAGATANAPLAPDDKELTPIEAMKQRALPEARTEKPSGG